MEALLCQDASAMDSFIKANLSFEDGKISPLGEKIPRYLDFLRQCYREKKYCFAPKEELDHMALKNTLSSQYFYVDSVEFLSYQSICQKLSTDRIWDVSVRKIALAKNFFIDKTSMPFYPGATIGHGANGFWKDIPSILNEEFPDDKEDIKADENAEAIYWHDALAIFANYLDLMFSIFKLKQRRNFNEKDRQQAVQQLEERRILRSQCERVLDILPYCLPLGKRVTKVIVLCK